MADLDKTDDMHVLTLDAEAQWAYSKFPHPLVTVDYDADGKPFKVVAVGPFGERLNALALAACERIAGGAL